MAVESSWFYCCKGNNSHPNDCDPSDECHANGGYCIRNSQKGDCKGLLFSKECKSALCSCCIDAILKRNECTQMTGICPTNSVCQDKDEGYDCVCNTGFEQCGDVNECVSNPCRGPHFHCVNTVESYNCVCDVGYVNVNGACEDIDECTCSPCIRANTHCANIPGSYACVCENGYDDLNGVCTLTTE
ncbi:protein disulfide isomerase Creld2-like isoform X2 [Macrobrachium rosenbergii]|uniref:protein disulfide isomerase Creld2-like isoform X2 n=1 Tax=Macrobrachium rosenbergii TaxID=79674 RepID=UPI0034D719E3